MIRLPYSSASLLFAIAACSPGPSGGELADPATLDQSPPAGETYFFAQQDFRRCVHPLCGGLWLSEVNSETTECAGGDDGERCYVTPVDFSAFPYDYDSTQLTTLEEQFFHGAALLVGSISTGHYEGSAPLGSILPTEVWTASVPDLVPENPLYEVYDTGMVCFTHPCETMVAVPLNGPEMAMRLAGIDFSELGLTPEEESAMYMSLFDGERLIVAGSTFLVEGPAGEAQALLVEQYYTELLTSECPAEDDAGIDWVSQDPLHCQAVRFACDEGQTPFSDDCGCGCILE